MNFENKTITTCYSLAPKINTILPTEYFLFVRAHTHTHTHMLSYNLACNEGNELQGNIQSWGKRGSFTGHNKGLVDRWRLSVVKNWSEEERILRKKGFSQQILS